MSARSCAVCNAWHYPRCVLVPQKWPLGPLLEIAARDAREGRGRITDIATILGVSGESVRLAAEFGLSDWQADRWAVRCGLHPACVWPGWLDAGLSVVDRQRIEEGGWRPAWLHTETHPTAASEAA